MAAGETTKPGIVIAGGGTGGHVFPALAIAAAASELAEVSVTFVGTARGLESRITLPPGHRLELLDVQPIKGGGAWRAVRGSAVAAVATARAIALLRRLRPRVVLSVGGYSSGPVAMAAAALGIPLAILEPNAAMGLANKVAAPFAQRAYLALVESENGLPKIPPTVRASSVRILGVPLRKGFRGAPYRASSSARILVLGGSQGAAPLNERLPEAIGRLVKDFPNLEVVHQSGRDRDLVVRNAYERENVACATVVPFIDDMAEAISRADLVVARSGAGTVAEIAAIGRAAILVPFPFAADDHQAKNADVFAKAGGCLAIRQEAADGMRLASEIERLLRDEAKRSLMADAARAFGKPEAARLVAEDLLRLGRWHVEAEAPPSAKVVTNGVARATNGTGTYRRIPETH